MDKTNRFGLSHLITWLTASHLLAAVSALIIWQADVAWSTGWRWAAALMAGTLFGMLLSGPLVRGVEFIAAALGQLAQGQPIAALSAGPRQLQPLAGVLQLVDALGARERELGRLREDLVRTTGEAAAQAERNRLARDLHDSIKQQLYAISVGAAAALARWERDPVGSRAAVEDVRRSAQAALAEMAALLQQLRPAPLAAVGLLDALREQGEALAHRTGAVVSVDLGGLDDAAVYAAAVDGGRLAPGAEEAIFRIAQEAMNNIARHARARNITLSLRVADEALRLEIADDGQGFAIEPAQVSQAMASGYGLAGMRDRATAMKAALEVISAPGSGTRIVLTVPLQDRSKAEAALSAEMQSSLQAVTMWQAVLGGSLLMGLAVGLGLIPRLTGSGYSPGGMAFSAVLLVAVAIVGRMARTRVQRAGLAVTLSCGADSATAWRLRRELAWGRVGLGIIAVIILPGALLPRNYPQYPLGAIAVAATCALFVFLTIAQAYHATERYRAQLSAEALAAELDQAWRQRYTWPLLLVAMAAGYFIYRSGLGTPWPPFVWPPSLDMVYDAIAIVVINLSLVALVVNYAQLRSWRLAKARSGGHAP